MRAIHRTGALLAGVLLLAACQSEDEGWTPVLEATPPSFLEREVAQALDEVREARATVGDAPDARAGLDRAEQRLSNLVTVYLPLYRAKVATTNAYRRQALGERDEALRLVSEAQESVAAVNQATGGDLEPELHRVVEPLADARLALEGGSDASDHLERAAETLQDLLTRAGLLP